MIEALGGFLIRTFVGVATMVGLWVESSRLLIQQSILFRWRRKETVDQIYHAAVESLPVVGLSLTFISMMLILEFSFHMKLVLRQDSLVPAFSTVLMLRELGPVVTALLLASRMGASIAAEIGSMKITEQLDALKLLAIDPVEYLILPRWIGCLFATVSLSVVSVAIAIMGGASIASLSMSYTIGEFFNTMFTFARFSDLAACLIKASVFGTLIAWVSGYYGFHCEAGSQGVGNAATNAVVQSSILIIVADFVLTYLLYAV